MGDLFTKRLGAGILVLGVILAIVMFIIISVTEPKDDGEDVLNWIGFSLGPLFAIIGFIIIIKSESSYSDDY